MSKTRGNFYLRFLDRYVGIFLARILYRRKRSFPSRIEKIGILKLAGIGDLILLSGVIADLRKHHPEASLTLFCGKENRAIASLIPGVTVVVLPLVTGVRLLRRCKLDLLLDFEQWARLDVLMSYFSKAKFTVGFKTEGQYRHYPFDLAIPHAYGCHEMENFRNIAVAIGVPGQNLPTLCFSEHPISLPDRYVMFHPWSISFVKEWKQWPRESWIVLGRYFKEQGYEIFITGGHQDASASEELARVVGGTSLAGKTPLPLLAHYLKKTACLITIDTGVMHLAAALKTPLIALFGPTSAHRWGPLSEKAYVLSGGKPFMYLGFEKPKRGFSRQMEQIAPEKVIAAFKALNESSQKTLCTEPLSVPN